MLNRMHYAVLLHSIVLASCSTETTVSEDARARVALTEAAKIRVGCEVNLGEGSGPTLDRCESYYPESITSIDFVADIPETGYVEWRFEVPPGEPLRVLRGCDRSSSTCTIGVTPRCEGEPRVYRVSVRNFDAAGTITATVPRAACQYSSPPPVPPPAMHPECASAERGKLCDFPAGALEAGQCDGIGQCVDCVNNGGCDEVSYCQTANLDCVPDTTPSSAPPLPPLPRPLPPLTPVTPPGYYPSTDCTGAARGTLCNFPFGASEADQCDGNGFCVDCVNNGGCDESSACNEQQQGCFSILDPQPPAIPPTSPPTAVDEGYETLTGDLNGDGRIDLYLRPQSGASPQAAPAFALVQQPSGGTFTLQTDLSTLNPSAFGLVNISLKYFDFNVDGVRDLYLRNLSSAVSGALDTFVFFEGAPSRRPGSVKARDAALETFFRDLRGFIDNREYFNTDVAFFANVIYRGYFLAEFLAGFGSQFNGVGFGSDVDYQDSTRFPHPVCSLPPFPCEFFPGFGWAIFAEVVFSENVYDYSRYAPTSIEAAGITLDIESDRTSPQALIDLFARIYLVRTGGDPDLNDVEPYDTIHGSQFWILNEVIQLLLTRFVAAQELPAPPGPALEFRAHPVGFYFGPYFHGSVHLNRNVQAQGSAAALATNEWYSAFPSNGPGAAFVGFGGRLQRRFRDKTDSPDRTVLMGDLAATGVSAELRWQAIRTRDFDNDWFSYCLFPETINCRNQLLAPDDPTGQGYNSNSFAFGLAAANFGFPLDERRKPPMTPRIDSLFRFPGSSLPVPAHAFR